MGMKRSFFGYIRLLGLVREHPTLTREVWGSIPKSNSTKTFKMEPTAIVHDAPHKQVGKTIQ